MALSSSRKSQPDDLPGGHVEREPEVAAVGTWWTTTNARLPLCVVVVLLMLVIAVATAAFLISLVVGTAADEFSNAAIQYAEEAAEKSAAEIVEIFKIPQQIVVQNSLALATRAASGRRVLDPGSIDDASVWVGPHMSNDIPLYFAFHDNITGNSTLILNGGFTVTLNNIAFQSASIGPLFVAAILGPPSALDECNVTITLRFPTNPTVVISSAPAVLQYDFRKLSMFDELMHSTDDSIRWYPPTVTYYDDDVRMVIAQPYRDLDTGAVRGIHLGMLVVKGISTLLLNLQYGQSELLSGTVALVDAVSGSFMGGNFIDNGVRRNTTTSTVVLPNGSSTTTTTTTTRLATLCEAHNDEIQLACRKLGKDALMGCSTPRSLFFRSDRSHWLLRGIESRTMVYVTSIRDHYGLDLRLVIILHLDTTLATLKRGMEVALLATVASIFVLLVVAGLVAYRSLLPLRVLETQLLLAANLHRGQRASDDGTSPRIAMSVSVYAEVESVLSAFTLLKADLEAMIAFFPPGFLGLDSNGVNEEGIGSAHQLSRDHSILTSAPFVGYSMVVAGNILQPHGSGSSSTIDAPKLVSSDAHMTQVTVLMLNLCGSHALSTQSLDAFSRHHSAMLNAIQQSASQSRGVVHAFYGDHFTITFNASSTTRCRNHVLQCATFIDLLHAEIAQQQVELGSAGPVGAASAAATPDHPDEFTPLVYAGVATGPALVRQMGGTRALQRLNVVGPVVTQASCLMRLARNLRAPTLVSDAVVAALRGVQLAAVDDAMASDNALTMLPHLAVHHVALVKVPFHRTPMIASSLWRAHPHPGPGPTAVDGMAIEARTLAERMKQASNAPNGLVPLHGDASCHALLCARRRPLLATDAVAPRLPRTTVAGLRAANDAMLAYERGDVKSTQELVAACATLHPPSLVRFFYMTGLAPLLLRNVEAERMSSD